MALPNFARPFWLLLSAGLLQAFGQMCQPPQLPFPDRANDIFSPQLEIELGDVQAEQLPRYLRISADPVVTSYLARVGHRLASRLPAQQLTFRYFLGDLPEPDAFAIAGGRIYITRGLVAFVRNENELAGVIAHEMGHIVTHQQAIATTLLLRDVLGVTQISSRRDIVVGLNRLEESWRRNPGAWRKMEAESLTNQEAADQVAVYAMTAAAYNPQAFITTFDRIAETRGNTGNWFTDVLGLTRPDQRRLREDIKAVQNLPPACIQPPSATVDDSDFKTWQTAALHFADWNRHDENLQGVVAKVKLEPIAGNISRVSFSPDGNYILAQERDEIQLLTREPFAPLFQISAADLSEAHFATDSRRIAFTTTGLHVELWDIAGQKRTQSYDLLEKRCGAFALSPDAGILACAEDRGKLSLIDLASQKTFFEQAHYTGSFRGLPVYGRLTFSPDGRYFLAATFETAVAFDLGERQPVRIPNQVREFLGGGFTFAGPNLVTYSPAGFGAYEDVRIFSFPKCKALGSLSIRPAQVSPVTGSNYISVRLLDGGTRFAIVDLNTKAPLVAFTQGTADIYGNEVVHTMPDGSIALLDAKDKHLIARTAFAVPGDLIRALASADLQWLAACGSSRCGLWNATTGRRLTVFHEFKSAWFDDNMTMFADMPARAKTPRSLVRVDLNAQTVRIIRPLDIANLDTYGRFLVLDIPTGFKQPTASAPNFVGLNHAFLPCGNILLKYGPLDCNVTVEFHDSVTGQLLWTRNFPKENPRLEVEPEENVALLTWPAGVKAARAEAQAHPTALRLDPQSNDNTAEFVEIVQAETGKFLQALLTGSSVAVISAGPRILLAHQSYVEVFSREGQKQGELLGAPVCYSNASELIAMREDTDRNIAVFDLKSSEKLDELTFSSKIDYARFSEDGRRLLVLTNDQTVYVINAVFAARQVQPNNSTEPPG